MGKKIDALRSPFHKARALANRLRTATYDDSLSLRDVADTLHVSASTALTMELEQSIVAVHAARTRLMDGLRALGYDPSQPYYQAVLMHSGFAPDIPLEGVRQVAEMAAGLTAFSLIGDDFILALRGTEADLALQDLLEMSRAFLKNRQWQKGDDHARG